MELAFLRQMRLPLPRQCPFCRIDAKMAQWVKNLRLCTRTCGKCGASFETSYTAADAAEILCKKCYTNEVL